MSSIIEAKVVQSKNTVALARWLLGKVLVTAGPAGILRRWRICEVEAYRGESDLACHARKGRTPRTEVMYAAGGVWYVYLCYGMHEMLNLVTGPRDYPSAILIRSVEGVMGPGRLTRTLAIDRRFNATVAAPAGGLWLEDDGFRLPRRVIQSAPRIGVAYAGPVWVAKPWRFYYEPPVKDGRMPPPGPASRCAR